jgi:hypothetical protein
MEASDWRPERLRHQHQLALAETSMPRPPQGGCQGAMAVMWARATTKSRPGEHGVQMLCRETRRTWQCHVLPALELGR